MDIIYEIPKKTKFDELNTGECFSSIRGTSFMKIEMCYRESNLNDLRNSINLETGKLEYFYPGDTIIPLKVTATVREVIQ